MASNVQGGPSFEDVERVDLSNSILFRQWERRSASARLFSLGTIAAMALSLLLVIVAVWMVSEHPNWAVAMLAFGLVAIGCAALYRRPLRFNSLIVAKGFVVWETQCSQPWKYLRRSFRFQDLDLPFRLKSSPLLIPVDEVTSWSIQEDERSDETKTTTVRIVLWRGAFALPIFSVRSRDRAGALEKAIRAAVERMNPAEAGTARRPALDPLA
jgi:hypothetical protein